MLHGKTKNTILDYLIAIPFFDRLSHEELQILAHHMSFFEISAGKTLFREGDTGNYVCFIVEGKLEVYKEAAEGHNAKLAVLGKGRSLGEMSIVDQGVRSATVKAIENTVVLILSRERFDSLIESNPKIGVSILKGLARLLSLNLRRTSAKLADFLVLEP